MGKWYLLLLLTPLVTLAASTTDHSAYTKFVRASQNKHAAPELAKDMGIPDNMHDARNMLANHHIKLLKQGEKIRLLLPSDQFFEHDVDYQYYQSTEALKSALIFYQHYGQPPVHIISHTDSVGDDDKLKTKSKRHAQSIAAYFWANGVPYSNMTIESMADQQKLDKRSSAKASASNRRIEVKFRQSATTAHPKPSNASQCQ